MDKFETHGWTFEARKGPIASSEAARELEERCGMPIPSMVFPDNALRLHHSASDFDLCFTAEGALRTVGKRAPDSLKVACHAAWQSHHGAVGAEAIAGRVEYVDYDWTFWPEYAGECSLGKWTAAPPGGALNDKRLSDVSEPIRFFSAVQLYEDELDDSGTVSVSVRVRVMSFGFLVLLRALLVVDHVSLQCTETRYYCDFGSPRLALWRHVRQAKSAWDVFFAKHAVSLRREPDALCRALPTVSETNHVLYL